MLFKIKINLMVDFPKKYLFERMKTFFWAKRTMQHSSLIMNEKNYSTSLYYRKYGRVGVLAQMHKEFRYK